MAFGDSITEGVLGSGFTTLRRFTSYPTQLLALLEERFPDQSFEIVNAGKAGETAGQGQERIRSELQAHSPDVVLLLEGVNSLRLTSDTFVTIFPDEAGDALERTARRILDANVDVIIATLTPVGDSIKHKQQPIDDLNRNIRSIASQLGIAPVVDLFTIFSADSSLIGTDDVHPTAEGYGVMAKAWFDELVRRYEVNPPEVDPDLEGETGDEPRSDRLPPP